MLARGWDSYARWWHSKRCEVVADHSVEYLGDEWTFEDAKRTGSSYGLEADVLRNFAAYLEKEMLEPYLPTRAEQGLEIGPGGGRVTALLVPRARTLHLADAAGAMLKLLKRRFSGNPGLRFYKTDGMTVPALEPESLDFVVSFDVFVHFEPRLVFWYLRQLVPLLKPGATGIIHYANVLTPLGWQQFERHLKNNVAQRTFFAAFGVMSPELMTRFLQQLELEIVSSDIAIIPRDAVAVFRKPTRVRL
jgi:SAM-dependent methyltransferase